MKFLILLAALCLSGVAFGNDFPPDFPSDPTSTEDEYSCSLNGQTARSQTFRYRSGAERFCRQYGDNCKVERRGQYQWQANFILVIVFNFSSQESWEHARSNVFNQFNRHINDNEYHHEYYRHSFNFGRCY